MHWNHRVMRSTRDGETWYGIHEVYYEQGDVTLWTLDPVEVASESLDGLRDTLNHMLAALDKPTLDNPEDEN